jgi:creatinine amidohydrolase
MGYSIFDETMVDMTWPEIEAAIRQKPIVLLPAGVMEEHGPHLSLAVDIYVSYQISRMIKHELEPRGTRTLIAPPYYWGINTLTGCFPGSFNVRPETLKAVLIDTLSSLKSWGLTHVFIINWHAEFNHNIAIMEGIKEARRTTGIQAYCVLNDYEARAFKLNGQEEYLIILKTPPISAPSSKYLDLHAGSLETGIMLNYFPEQVNAGLARSLEATKFTIEDLKAVRNGGSQVREKLTAGYFGDPAGYDLEASRLYLESRAHDFARAIENSVKNQ